jgi:WD40 repeat protein
MTKIAVQGSILITADYDLKLWDIETLALLHSFTGHATSVSQLIITQDGKHCLSAAAEDRYTSVWSLEPDANGKMSSSNVGGIFSKVLII